jgi:hypothetical protein
MDYLRGHYSDFANQREQTFMVKFPPLSVDINNVAGVNSAIDAEVDSNLQKNNIIHDSVVVSIPTDGEAYGLLQSGHDTNISSVFESFSKEVPKEHHVSLLCVLRAIDGLKSSQQSRLRVICLRIQCLVIASHSRISPNRLQAYSKISSVLLNDLLLLSDISSEAFTELQLPVESLPAILLMLECTTGLLECNQRRRGPLLNGILVDMGLSRAGREGTFIYNHQD